MSSEPEFDAPDNATAVPRLCRYLSELSPQPMVAVDGITHVVSYVNPAFVQLVRMRKRDLVGRPFADAVPEGTENGCLKMLDRVFRTGRPENLAEQEHHQVEPQPAFWSYAMWAILGANGRPVGVMIQITNTTETAIFRQHAVAMNESLLIAAAKQHELTQAAQALSTELEAAVQMRDRFIAVMSHELRNPLATLSNGLEVLKLTDGNAVTAENTRNMMERQLKQMVRLVNDLLDVSRITTGKLQLQKERTQLASVLEAVAEASQAMIKQHDHKLIVSLPPEPILLDADPARLNQVFSNLLHNAVKYSERGATIRLSAELDRGEAVVSVQDNGIGIPADALAHVFETFAQVDPSWLRTQGGMGIGLSLVKNLVELHGGRVKATSAGIGQGTEIFVRLPLAAEATGKPIASAQKARSTQKRILVVDDNRDAAATLAMLLKLLGHDVHVAHNGEDAVAAAETCRPQLVLMDLGMPNMNGYEACQRIRATVWGRKLFLVALTGWGSVDDLRRTVDAGFDRHLVKPVDSTAIVKMIAELGESKS